MSDQKLPVSTPRGTRDYGPEESLERQYIRSRLQDIFSIYGFLPLETPTMEHREVLSGQYGEEGEKLIFYILKSGDYLKDLREEPVEVKIALLTVRFEQIKEESEEATAELQQFKNVVDQQKALLQKFEWVVDQQKAWTQRLEKIAGLQKADPQEIDAIVDALIAFPQLREPKNEKVIAQFQQLKKESEKVTPSFQLLERKVELQKADLQQREPTNKELRATLQQVDQQLDQQVERVVDLQKGLSQWIEQLVNLQQREPTNKELRATLQQIKKEVELRKADFQQLDKKNEEKKATLQQIEQGVEALNQQFEYFKRVTSLLKDHKDTINSRIDHLEKVQRLKEEVQGENFSQENEKAILKSINHVEKHPLLPRDVKELTPKLADRALRYDLTVPMARFVAAQGDALPIPFKRYQMQPVWRADRPQKSRFREFYQCDVDIVGSSSPLCEVDMLLLVHEVFTGLGLSAYRLRINHRGLLTLLSQKMGASEREQDLCLVLDKMDKIGQKGVTEELRDKGFSSEALLALAPWFELKGSPSELLAQLSTQLGTTSQGILDELSSILQHLHQTNPQISEQIEIDPCLARGLNYYTGLIFEVTYPGTQSSCLGGGRYDHLIDRFSSRSLTGIGLSVGLERVHELMRENDCLPSSFPAATQLLIAHLGAEGLSGGLRLLHLLRQEGICCEYYPSAEKLKKQFQYAEKRHIPYLLFAGPDEQARSTYGLKDISTGQQYEKEFEALVSFLKSKPTASPEPSLP